VLPGADVRIEGGMIGELRSGRVLTLADHKLHVLLELPHELYFPLQPVLADLRAVGMVGVLSHPERNQGLLCQPALVEPLVEEGCLMQLTAGSLLGAFGARCQEMAEWMVRQGLVHFVATDAHGPRSRRPLMRRAFERVSELAGEEAGLQMCCRNPAAVAAGQQVPTQLPVRKRAPWFHWRKAS
jgi:protein-tyrosine phosphatase